MLIMVVMVFFICNLLALLVNILELTPYYKLVPKLSQISNGLVIINSSMNILIYCTFGKKFRTVFMQIFFGKQPPCIITTSRSVAHTYGNKNNGKNNHINHTQSSYISNNSTTNGTNGSETVPLTSFPNHLDLPNTRQGRLFTEEFRSSTCPLTGFFWLLSHVIYLNFDKSIIRVFSFSISQNFNF